MSDIYGSIAGVPVAGAKAFGAAASGYGLYRGARAVGNGTNSQIRLVRIGIGKTKRIRREMKDSIILRVHKTKPPRAVRRLLR
jgi:hypothetical protein